MLRLVALSRPLRRALVVACDLIVCVLAVWIAYWLRLGEWELLSERVLIFTALAIGGWAAVALWQRTYRSVTRFAGAHTIVSLARSCALLAAILAVVLFIARFNSLPGRSRSSTQSSFSWA
jgi:FlaA1/EpsC-like NDP-sugar epimerase